MSEVVLYATIIAREGQYEFLEKALSELARSSRTEPGNIRFEVYVKESKEFYLEESYHDKAALEAHNVSPHRQKFDAIVPDKVADFEVVFLTPVN